jgi:hypothetical protein
MTFGRASRIICNNSDFEQQYWEKIRRIFMKSPVNRGPAHAMKDDTTAETYELMHVTEEFSVSADMFSWQETALPNLPWAEDHFQERVGGEPLNPAPSEAWWPFARQGNAEHKKDQRFSHTYPERFWPKHAGDQEPSGWDIYEDDNPVHSGIRFTYGDLGDLIEVLKKNHNTRQAYLPIWFPEDLYAAKWGERVPCSMGYHFIYNPASAGLDCVYTMRSCDLVRFYRDDIYMAGRLLQWVGQRVDMRISNLVVHIDNLHCFPNDRPYLESLLPQTQSHDVRSSYNFEALG